MKTLKYIVCTAVLFALCGCNLNEDPDYFTERKKFFHNENQCRAAVDACYNCISYIADLADHFGDKEYAAEIRDRFNSLLGVEEESAS